MAEPKVLGMREILSSFRATLATARQTGEPVVIALRRRKPVGVLLGYETWLALKAPPSAQADSSALQVELRAERQRNSELAAKLADARRQVEDLSRDLAAARQRVAELEAQLASPPDGQPEWRGLGCRIAAGTSGQVARDMGELGVGRLSTARSASEVRLGPIVSGTCAGFSDAIYRAW